MISDRNTILPGNNCDLHDLAGRVEVPSYTTDRTDARDYGPEPIDAKTAMEAANLLDAVRAANAPRLTVRLALVAGLLSQLDLLEPEETTE